MKKIHIAASPLTGTIFAGHVLKDGRTWGAGKQDVTIDALVAVAEHVIKYGKAVEITKYDGTLLYLISVDDCRRLKIDWMQIESAPKDGTWILVINARINDARPHVVHYSERFGKKFPWLTGSGAMSSVAGVTHWMPLPESPEL